MSVKLKARNHSSKDSIKTYYGYPATVNEDGIVYVTVPDELAEGEIASGRLLPCEDEIAEKKEAKKRTRKADNSADTEANLNLANTEETQGTAE